MQCSAKRNQLGPFALTEDRFRAGGEDLPNAYRLVPMKPDESWGAIVAYYDPHAQAPCFRPCYGLLFGLPSAVTLFNHVESLASLLSSYFKLQLGALVA